MEVGPIRRVWQVEPVNPEQAPVKEPATPTPEREPEKVPA